MKVLITGISGLLGSEVAAALGEDHELIGLTRTSTLPGVKVCNADLCDQSAVYSLVTKINPDVIIHSAAQSNVDGCEKDPDSAYRNNALGTRNLALACQRFDASMIYISTDYVFSGRNAPEKGYTEFDAPAPLNVYARSKYEGERYVRELVNRFTVARVSWLFGPARSNFVIQAAEALKKGTQGIRFLYRCFFRKYHSVLLR
ncbi:MAG TPA: NAD(P)-dependent oxidoreductase [Bacteroidales bacterium]|nr:NAD(P)-dependent oxidoreductase [Bacteroidales bacterium]